MKRAKSLRIEDLEVGTGAAVAQAGDAVEVLFRCRLNHGELLHEYRDRVNPAVIRVGARDCFVGIEHGVIGMKVCGKRLATAPAHLNHIEQQVFPELSPDAVLHYEIELLGFRGRWSSD